MNFELGMNSEFKKFLIPNITSLFETKTMKIALFGKVEATTYNGPVYQNPIILQVGDVDTAIELARKLQEKANPPAESLETEDVCETEILEENGTEN